ncbi:MULTISPECIES: serine/threonine-protein kinase [Glycomyces]|uniref:non-specific serine/threonine protein kinase n=2 Tax=Glycomyces TaxID=58113 RepID=A0A9X3T7D7_9ACTN|nr:serine/threonine-protein kinase [Glycomyces lechevalierae]MDA1384118.1 serine/threonine-protein kinase [Glycomyces lechevalierae]MDR7339453.1 tRNA A-37 threonylcarbamoyl transferase component Bud32 [Glycomyces lechevalierae]
MPAGQLIADRYRLDELIGAGGMGEVWRAFDTGLHRDVAIKLLYRSGFESAEAAHARFVREAQAVARIRHPGIAVLHDFGEDPGPDGRSYLVMEYVEGRPLSAVLADGPLPPDTAMRLCADVADALATAHSAGVIHRDIKPANIIVGTDTRPRLVDFGIALLPDETALTGPDVRLGTLTYASPEQIDGEPLTPASDLYSLGVVAYECLSGEPPFTGPSLSPVVHGHLHKPPPELPSDVPAGARNAVMRALEKDPARRWRDAADLAAACRGDAPDEETTLPLGPPPASARNARRRTLLAAAIATPIAAGATALTLWLNQHRDTDTDPPETAITTVRHDGLVIAAHDEPIEAIVALPGENGPVAYTAAGTQLRQWNLADGAALGAAETEHPVTALLLAPAPGGGERVIAVDRASGVYVADTAAEFTRIGTGAFDAIAAVYAPHQRDQSTLLTAMTPMGCATVDLDTGAAGQGMIFQPGFIDHAVLAPNRGELAVAHAEPDGAVALHHPADGSVVGRVPPHPDWDPETARTGGLWFTEGDGRSPRGHVYNETDQRFYQVDLWTYEAIGAPVALGPVGSVHDLRLLPDGSILTIEDGHATLTSTETGARVRLTAAGDPEPVALASLLTPDSRIALTGYADGTVRTWQLD